MGIDPNQICKGAWRRIVLGSDVDPRLYSKFDDRCLDNMVNAENFTPSKQCVFERSGDKFVLDKKGQKRELPELKVISCLVNLAIAEKWLVDAPKAIGLPSDVTPTVVDAPKDSTPVAVAVDVPKDSTPVAVTVDAPKDVTAVDAPVDATPVGAASDPTATAVELPGDVTPSVASNFSWFSRFFAEVGGGIWMQLLGLSVNGAAPVDQFGAAGFTLRVGGLFTHIKLSDTWEYETAAFANMGANLSDSEFANIYDIGGGISPQFSYTLPKTDAVSYKGNPIVSKVIFAPDVTAMAGILWSKAPVDVGIPDKLYWASDSYIFPEMTVGMGVYLEVYPEYKDLSFTFGVHAGARVFWHKDSVTNLPAGMPTGTEVRLKSPMVDVLQLQFGFRY